MKKVFLLNGAARSGKDTVANIMRKELEAKGKSIEVLSFAEPLKQIIAKTFDISLGELEIYKNKTDKFTLSLLQEGKNTSEIINQTNFRKILQRFGTEGMKTIFGESVWVDLINDKIKKSNAEYFIISDFRFQIEAKTILNLSNRDIAECYFFYVDSDMSTISENLHSSEKDLDTFTFDYYIHNMKGKLHETEFVVSELIQSLMEQQKPV